MNGETACMNKIDDQNRRPLPSSLRARECNLGCLLVLPPITMLLLSLVFPPVGLWWLAPVALTPLILAAGRERVPKIFWLYVWLTASIYYVINLNWLSGITGAGYIALSIYCGFYLALFFLLTHCLYRLKWMPLWLSAPIVFTALEYLRGHLFTGFPWYTLGVAFTGSAVVRQAAGIFGAAGLSFLAVLTAAVFPDVAGLIIAGAPCATRQYQIWAGALFTALLWGGVIGFGLLQLRHPPYRTGPRVAVLQQNIPQSLKASPSIAGQKKLFNSYYQLTLQAARRFHPNLIAWPETMVPGFLNPSWIAQSPAWYARGSGRRTLVLDQEFVRRLTALAKKYNTAVLVGSSAVRFNRHGRVAAMQNISVLFTPRRGEARHYYAKRHLVPFGEYIPFKKSAPWLHRILYYFTPYKHYGGHSLTPGTSWHHFVLNVGSKSYRFGTPICYEDAMARPAREFCRPHHGVKGADFLVVISNDGWYQSRAELLQHLQLDQLRAVENRVSIARCVNGGYCGFVSPSGRVIRLVSRNGHHAFVSGVAAANLPIDRRITIFARGGYLFSPLTLVAAGLLLALRVTNSVIGRQKRRAAV